MKTLLYMDLGVTTFAPAKSGLVVRNLNSFFSKKSVLKLYWPTLSPLLSDFVTNCWTIRWKMYFQNFFLKVLRNKKLYIKLVLRSGTPLMSVKVWKLIQYFKTDEMPLKKIVKLNENLKIRFFFQPNFITIFSQFLTYVCYSTKIMRGMSYLQKMSWKEHHRKSYRSYL